MEGQTTEAAEELKALLVARDASQRSVAIASGTSQAYLNQVVNGGRLASAAWLDTIAEALNLSDKERQKLHRAAARDHGFKIDLT